MSFAGKENWKSLFCSRLVAPSTLKDPFSLGWRLDSPVWMSRGLWGRALMWLRQGGVPMSLLQLKSVSPHYGRDYLSEDLADGQNYGGPRVVNPFRGLD